MKNFWKVFTAMTLTAAALAGCGAAGTAGETAATSAVGESGAETSAEDETSKEAAEVAQETLTPDPTNLTYLEEYQIADFYGDGKEYALYAPKGGENTDGFFYYDDHGITFTASIYGGGSLENLQMYLEDTVKLKLEDWKNDPECSDVGVGETLENGDDCYLFLTANKKDYNGAVYQKKMLTYMSVREGGAGVFWDMELREYEQDEETDALIAEVARCYGLNLSELSVEDGTWAKQSASIEEERQDEYKPEEGDPVLEKVEGYQYLGMLTLTLNEEDNVTCPVLAPMGWNTDASKDRVSTNIHGVSVTVHGDHTDATMNYQAMAQRAADRDLKYYSDPEQECRNVRASEVMPMQGQEAGVYYVLAYEEKEYKTEEYHERANVTCYIQVKEKHFVICDIYLRSWEYDSRTNDLIKELETAYGLDLSEWYAM